jgi:DNA-binding NarL/FixJ family response regulator
MTEPRTDRPPAIRILIADDNQMIRDSVGAILASEGWDVCGQASDGEEAILKARELRPDLVVLDVSMPGIDGLETARRLRKENAEMKIVIISQHDPARLLPRALEVGANACVDKGRVATDIGNAIRGVMGRK